MLKASQDPWELLKFDWRNKTVACDEVGCGIVPGDPVELEYREQVGRICCELAKHAEFVERMYCEMCIRDRIYLAPAQFEAMFVSNAHTEDEIRYTIKAAKKLGGEI